MAKYPQKVLFDIKGIHLSVLLISLATIPFIVYADKYNKIGHMYVLLALYILLFSYLLIVFIRTYGSAIIFKENCIIDNHRILGLPRKIKKQHIETVELKEKYTKRGLGKFVEIKKFNSKRTILLLDDRIDCTVDELYEWVKEWQSTAV